MKKILSLFIFIFSTAISFAQKESFDLISYTPPKGWKKEVTENIITYTIVDNKNNSWCRVSIVKSTSSKGNIDADFDSEWQGLVVKSYKITEAPKLNEVQETSGWKIKAGGGNFVFNNSTSMALLTTASGYNRCASIVATTNSQDYLKDIEALLGSVDLKKPEIIPQQTTAAIEDKTTVIGTWGANASDNSDYRMKNAVMNSLKRQYTFRGDGTYQFITKAFDPLMNHIILGKESGTYQINGTTVTINPKRSVLESWSKKDGTDKWGKLLSTENIPLEKITYSFTKHYFSGIQIWSLVLIADKPTNRDGPFCNNKSFENAWYYNPISPNNPVIELPNGEQANAEIKKVPLQKTTAAINTAIAGSWGVSTTVASAYNMHINEGSIITQYIFNSNGSYSFHMKTFRYQLDKLLLTKETGTYQINGNELTLNPQRSVIEAWSKKDGTDNWGKLLSSEKKELEKITYQFSTQDLGSGMVLILKANAPTKRDGRFNNSDNNAWFYPAKSKIEEIKLPG
jgi:hypothetical protein